MLLQRQILSAMGHFTSLKYARTSPSFCAGLTPPQHYPSRPQAVQHLPRRQRRRANRRLRTRRQPRTCGPCRRLPQRRFVDGRSGSDFGFVAPPVSKGPRLISCSQALGLRSTLRPSRFLAGGVIAPSSTPTRSIVRRATFALREPQLTRLVRAVYSLGIIFFELCHPFKTGMERIQVS